MGPWFYFPRKYYKVRGANTTGYCPRALLFTKGLAQVMYETDAIYHNFSILCM